MMRRPPRTSIDRPNGPARTTLAGVHRSRIGVFLIDVPDGEFDGARSFWSGAVGVESEPEADDPDYESLGRLHSLKLFLQRTGRGTPPRVHLDIETDDVPAEVARLQALGATIDTEHQHFTVMRDPVGLVFCVVPVQTGADFEPNATVWP